MRAFILKSVSIVVLIGYIQAHCYTAGIGAIISNIVTYSTKHNHNVCIGKEYIESKLKSCIVPAMCDVGFKSTTYKFSFPLILSECETEANARYQWESLGNPKKCQILSHLIGCINNKVNVRHLLAPQDDFIRPLCIAFKTIHDAESNDSELTKSIDRSCGALIDSKYCENVKLVE